MGEDLVGLRAIILLAIFGFLALLDLKWRRQGLTERKLLYCVVLCCTACGMLFAALFDQFTCTLSPEYFVYWKELNAQSPGHLRLLALDLGLAAGFLPGLLTGLCFSIACLFGKSKGTHTLSSLLRWLVLPLAAIAIAAVCLGTLHYNQQTSELFRAVKSLDLNAEQVRMMNTVWGIHKGAYVGGTIGTVLGTVLIANQKPK